MSLVSRELEAAAGEGASAASGSTRAQFWISTAEANQMRYRVYSGPAGSERISPLEKERMLFKEFGTLDEAVAWANHVKDGGRVALLIEGDDGTHLERADIAKALHRYSSEHVRQTGAS
jgi:hypothetical protein